MSTGFGSKKVEGGGGLPGEGDSGDGGERGSSRQSVSYRQSGGSEQSGAGGCLRDSLGDVVRGYHAQDHAAESLGGVRTAGTGMQRGLQPLKGEWSIATKESNGALN